MTLIERTRPLALARRGVESLMTVASPAHCPQSTATLLRAHDWAVETGRSEPSPVAPAGADPRDPADGVRSLLRRRGTAILWFVEANGWYVGMCMGAAANEPAPPDLERPAD